MAEKSSAKTSSTMPKAVLMRVAKPKKALMNKAAKNGQGLADLKFDMMREVVQYRGNVPLRSFLGWVLLVLLGVTAVGLLASQLLISQRQNQLIEETAARVELQGQSRAGVLNQWMEGLKQQGDGLASSNIMQIFVTEFAAPEQLEPGMRAALQAQQPYMQQAVREFVRQNQLIGAAVVGLNGDVLLKEGVLPEKMATDALQALKQTARGQILPLRLSNSAVVMDVMRPIFGMDAVKPIGALWFALPVGDKFAELLASTNLDRPGERSALVQQTGEAGRDIAVVGRTALAPLNTAFEDFRQSLASGRALSLSAVDGRATFATLTPVLGTPFHVLQEYRASNALSLMNLYKRGIYIIVALFVVVLAAFMLAMTIHLMAQRNRTRVKLLGQTMDALVRVVEARDPYLVGHHQKVARLVVALGNKLKLTVGERATLFYAAQLSAVGRLLVPREILMKSGSLTPKERERLEAEVAKSQQILIDLDFDLPIVAVINQMYERIDGSGYPGGLKGNEISRMGQILGMVDAYCAMTADRSYRNALTPTAAQKQLVASGKFSADYVDALKGIK